MVGIEALGAKAPGWAELIKIPVELNAQSAMGPVSTGKATKGLRPEIYAARCQRCDGKGWVEAAN
jgi:hypothetical protein